VALPSKFDPVPLVAWGVEYGSIPDDYITLDIESSGIDVNRDLPLQLGWCVVKNRKAVLEEDVLIDWTKTLTATQLDELAVRMDATRRRMAEKEKAYPWTIDMLRSKGMSAVKAVTRFASALGSNPTVAAHYGWLFDYPALGRTFDLIGQEFSPEHNRMYDTGLMLKACLVGISPARNEPLAAYTKRLHTARCSVRHNLEAASELFDLRTTSGADKGSQHRAGYDAWLVHLLLERLRPLMAMPQAKVEGVRRA